MYEMCLCGSGGCNVKVALSLCRKQWQDDNKGEEHKIHAQVTV